MQKKKKLHSIRILIQCQSYEWSFEALKCSVQTYTNEMNITLLMNNTSEWVHIVKAQQILINTSSQNKRHNTQKHIHFLVMH